MTFEVIAPAGGDADALTARDRELPAPGPRQVLVAVRAVSVDPTDWKVAHRSWPPTEPLLLGCEAAGVVTALGGDAAARGDLSVGDAVITYPVLGAYASDVLAPVEDVLPAPATLDFAQAANLLLVGTTAAQALQVADLRSGETVVVHGASGATGLSLLQQAAPLGVRVLATTSERSADLVRCFGGEPVAYGPGLEQRLRAAAPGGVDATVDCVGTDEAMDASLALVADRNRIVSITDGERARVLGVRFIDGREPDGLAYRNAQRRRLVEMAATSSLTVPVARTFPLTVAGAQEAIALLRSGHPGGKLALVLR